MATITDLFFYEHSGGVGELYTAHQGALNLLRTHMNLGSSWTHIIPGQFGFGPAGFTDLLFYDGAGTGAFYTTDGQGGIAPLRTHTGWVSPAGIPWTHIIPGRFTRKGFTDLLCYDSAGTGAFYTCNGLGGIEELRTQTGWVSPAGIPWTHIIPGSFAERVFTDLLFYDSAGNFAFYTTNGQGGIEPLQTRTGWASPVGLPWTHIIPGQFGGRVPTDLLCYDSAGTGVFFTSDGQGRIYPLRTHTGWVSPAGLPWTHITPGSFGGSGFTDLLFYDSAGNVAFYTSDGQGQIYPLSLHGGSRSSWTRIIPGLFAANYVLRPDDPLIYQAGFADANLAPVVDFYNLGPLNWSVTSNLVGAPPSMVSMTFIPRGVRLNLERPFDPSTGLRVEGAIGTTMVVRLPEWLHAKLQYFVLKATFELPDGPHGSDDTWAVGLNASGPFPDSDERISRVAATLQVKNATARLNSPQSKTIVDPGFVPQITYDELFGATSTETPRFTLEVHVDRSTDRAEAWLYTSTYGEYRRFTNSFAPFVTWNGAPNTISSAGGGVAVATRGGNGPAAVTLRDFRIYGRHPWTYWTSVSAGFVGVPGAPITAVPWGARFALFATDLSGVVHAAGGDPNGLMDVWAPGSAGFVGVPGAPVTAVPWGPRFALFATDSSGVVHAAGGDPNGLMDVWAPGSAGLVGVPGAPVTAVPWGPRFALFATDSSGVVHAAGGDPNGLMDVWAPMSARFVGVPGAPVTAVPWGPRFALFATDSGGVVHAAGGDPNGLMDVWAPMSARFVGVPGAPVTAVPWGPRFALFATDSGGVVHAAGGDPNGLMDVWASMSGGFVGVPGAPVTAVPWGPGFALFATDSSGVVHAATGDPQNGLRGSWASVSEGRSTPGAPIAAVPWGQQIALFLTDPNGEVYTNTNLHAW